METKIKNILTELVSFIAPHLEKVSLKDAYEKLGFDESYSLIKWILHWQKNIYNKNSAPIPFFQKDRFILDEPFQERFPKLFEYCPELKNVYTLHSDKITFNEGLSREEINEVLGFIDKHHIIETRRKIG